MRENVSCLALLACLPAGVITSVADQAWFGAGLWPAVAAWLGIAAMGVGLAGADDGRR